MSRHLIDRRSTLTSLVLIGLALALIGCAGPGGSRGDSQSGANQGTGVKKRIAAAIRGEPHTLSDEVNSAGPGGVAGVAEISVLISAGLADVDQTVVFDARLAEALPTIENGLWKVFPDGRMETTWRLKQKATWHDGTPFTAEDLLFTARVGQDRQVALLRDRAYDFIDGIEAPDPHTLTVKWSKTYLQADNMFSDFAVPLPKHLLQQPFEEDKATFTAHPYWTAEFVGTGPFRLREFARGSHLLLEAFDGYVLGRPKIDEIEVKFFLDPNVIIANLLAGTIDLTIGRGISLEQGVQARDQWRQGKLDLSFESWIALFPQFIDPDPPAIADARFRRALMHAIDRQQLIDTFAYGMVTVPHSFINPGVPDYRETEAAAVRYDYDLRRATQLIEEVGFVRGTDGAFRTSGGQPLRLEIRTTSGDDFRDKLLFGIAEEWKGAGLGVDTVIIPRQRAEDREYRATRPGFELVRQPNNLSEGALRRFMSREAALPENDYRAQNRTRYMSAELDGLIDGYLTTIPRAQRLDITRQMVRHVSENLPVMGITYNVEGTLISNRLANVNAALNTRNGHEWEAK